MGEKRRILVFSRIKLKKANFHMAIIRFMEFFGVENMVDYSSHLIQPSDQKISYTQIMILIKSLMNTSRNFFKKYNKS